MMIKLRVTPAKWNYYGDEIARELYLNKNSVESVHQSKAAIYDRVVEYMNILLVRTTTGDAWFVDMDLAAFLALLGNPSE